jgi:DNA polymerase-3 subunit beta
MELTVERAKLVHALETASSVVSSRPTLPILGNVMMDVRRKDIVLTATDLEVGIVLRVDADQQKGEGKITVPARKLLDVVKEMPGDKVEIALDNGTRLTLRSGSAEIKLLGLAPDEFPQLPEVKKEAETKVPAAVLDRMIRKTLHGVSSDESRYVLNGAYVVWEKNELKMVTTDGRRLAYIRQPLAGTGGKGEAVVPTKALAELLRLLAAGDAEVSITLGEGYAKFSIGSALLTTRLIDGNFPDYEQVIPKAQDKKIVLDAEALHAAVRRCALIAVDRASSVRLDLKKGGVVLSAASHELGEAREEVPVAYDGEGLSVAYNARFLIDVLKNVDTKEVVLELSTALAPGILRPQGDDTYLCVVMPIRL